MNLEQSKKASPNASSAGRRSDVIVEQESPEWLQEREADRQLRLMREQMERRTNDTGENPNESIFKPLTS